MFKVRFYDDKHTAGYQPAQHLDQVRERLLKLLKRQGMGLHHTDGEWAYYAQVRKPRKVSKPKPRGGMATGPRLARRCGWYYSRWRWEAGRWRGEPAHWARDGIRCPSAPTSFLANDEAYCDLHASKGIGLERYWKQRTAEDERKVG